MLVLILYGVALLVAIHLAVTYLASERLNVFTALCMLSMLPAAAAGVLAAIVALMLVDDRTAAAAWAAACFAILVLPYTGQGLWELVTRKFGHSAARPSSYRDPTRGTMDTRSAAKLATTSRRIDGPKV
jgi:hypothetical protein